MTPRRRYPCDLTDAQWQLIEPFVSAWRATRAGGRTPTTDLREVVNAILYVTRTGIAWRYLPHDFPPHTTVYDYFTAWESDGIAEQIHAALREQVRRRKGRRVLPSAAVIDAQSVKASPNAPETTQGYDAGKRIKGRKRHIATDTLGLLLVVLITAASVQDSTGGKQVLDHLHAHFPGVSKVWADGGYKNGAVAHGAALGIDVELVQRDPQVKGFAVQPRRWIVEQTLGILARYRRLHRDYETHPERSRAMVHWAMIGTLSHRLTGTPVRFRRNTLPKQDASA
ncbi:IS5-like element ISSco3 family transposase [Streptosporangium fragile]|uniref:IS5-like element ISSco3 family transposase n=1 Tax=Streptosporangium fragile TaxID=46186 RepID=A0ABP6J0R7_9ACTN